MPRPLSSPRPPRYDASKAISDLSFADPKLGKLIERAGPFTMRVASAQSPFEALVESIIYQQLHGKAAATIHRRMIESFAPAMTLEAAGTGAHPTPQQLLECPNEQLRAAGLSKNKMLALRDLAAKTIDGTVPTLAQIRRMSDEAIIEHLTQVRGIGVWTVHMMLIFRLGRPDVLPTSDYGVRKGFSLTFGKLKPTDKVTPGDLAIPADMERRAKKWAPGLGSSPGGPTHARPRARVRDPQRIKNRFQRARAWASPRVFAWARPGAAHSTEHRHFPDPTDQRPHSRA